MINKKYALVWVKWLILTHLIIKLIMENSLGVALIACPTIVSLSKHLFGVKTTKVKNLFQIFKNDLNPIFPDLERYKSTWCRATVSYHRVISPFWILRMTNIYTHDVKNLMWIARPVLDQKTGQDTHLGPEIKPEHRVFH